MIAMTVNARAVKASVEPRTHLADFLRDELDLTGTHLGCEHGVCGACTLLLDDMPARSCITYTVACDGARVTTIEGGRTALGPAGSGSGATTSASGVAEVPAAKAELRAEDNGAIAIPDFTPKRVFEDHFTVAYPRETVFDMFGDVTRIAACLPGASLTAVPTPERVEGMIRVKLGPIAANFHGAARIERNSENLSGRIVGTGRDQRSRSSTQGEIRYHLVPIEQGTATRVELSIGYSLKGMLAQIAREGLVRDLAARLTAEFARNLERQLSGTPPDGSPAEAQNLNGVSLLMGLLGMRAREALRRVFGR